MAARLAEFAAAATATLDIAIYDLRLDGAPGAELRRALVGAATRGVRMRMVYNLEERGAHDGRDRLPLPPPSFVDRTYLESLPVEHRHIPGIPDLMHHKYAVRDLGRPGAAVWTGSANWTIDSWTREENVIVRLAGEQPASAYGANFDELWSRGEVQSSGHEEPEWHDLAGARVRAFFNPGRSSRLVHEIARQVGGARRRLRVCSPVITSGPILATLAEALRRPGLDVAGCYDRTQMDEVERQWAARAKSGWKLSLWQTVAAGVAWGEKRSTPYQEGSVHDFMHAKCVVADDMVFAGSYNLSHSGEDNAENVVEISSVEIADRFTAYIDSVSARYRPAGPSDPG